QASGSESRSRLINLINENILTYQESFGSHEFTGLLGASFQHQGTWNNSIGTVTGSYSNETIRTINNAVVDPTATSSSNSQLGLATYFGTVIYYYVSLYLFFVAVRTDGSSRFGTNNGWGYSPSASAAWRISQEQFIQVFETISELKLRASYGVNGNFNIE